MAMELYYRERPLRAQFKLQIEYSGAVSPPNPSPFEHEPWRKVPRARLHLPLQRFRTDPAPGENFAAVDLDSMGSASDEHRTKLIFGARFVELRLVLELEQKMQRAAQPEFLIQAAVDRRLHGLGAARMAAAAIRPIQRPQAFECRPLLQQ